MKTLRYTKTLIALAVAIAAAAATVGQAQEKPIPPPATENALPPEIAPNSPAAQVVKLVQSGTDIGVIKNFVANSSTAFGLDTDQVIALNDVGVPAEIINAMMNRDKMLFATKADAPAPAVVETAPPDAPPAAPITVDYFNDTLTPYGAWVEVEGYGRCWRPTVVNYDSGWRPYCDRGHWVYTDCGWYWDSDYSWGVTFHYGRWFHHARFGWCWYPDTEWAPSWVTWRSGGEYCGWAPLPPLAVFRPGVGFFYRGAGVAVDFDFGLSVDCFTFVEPSHFCDHHPRRYCPAPERVTQIFNHTTVINNYNIHNTTIVNHGIGIAQINAGNRRPIQPVSVGSLPNAGRQGWRGDGGNSPGHHAAADDRGAHPAHPVTVTRPSENRGFAGHQNAAAASPSAGGSVVIQHQPSTAGLVDTGRFNRDQPSSDASHGAGNLIRRPSQPVQSHDTAPAVSSATPASAHYTAPVVAERIAPLQPPSVPERQQTHDRPAERPVEAAPHIEAPAHNYTPPAAPSASPAHESERSSSRSSEHSSDSKDSKDKKDR